MKFIANVDSRIEERQERKRAALAVLRVNQIFDLLCVESQRFARTRHRRLDLIDRKCRVRVIADRSTNRDEQCVESAAPDSSLEQAADDPSADPLSILGMLAAGQ